MLPGEAVEICYEPGISLGVGEEFLYPVLSVESGCVRSASGLPSETICLRQTVQPSLPEPVLGLVLLGKDVELLAYGGAEVEVALPEQTYVAIRGEDAQVERSGVIAYGRLRLPEGSQHP